MAAPPAAEIARQRAAMAPGGGDSISFSAAARRLSEARAVGAPRGVESAAMPEAATRSGATAGTLVGARVAGAVRFEEAIAATQPRPSAATGSFPFYRDPGQANAAATAVAGSRLDVTA